MEYVIEVYETKNNKLPFNEWLKELDSTIKQRVRTKIDKIFLGNFGDFKSIGEGINELKIDVGPGYRIYYSMIDKRTMLILCAGSKRTQKKDITKAKNYLKDFKRERTHGKK